MIFKSNIQKKKKNTPIYKIIIFCECEMKKYTFTNRLHKYLQTIRSICMNTKACVGISDKS